jgi:uncharacterized repeat protein (TIGR01451 family)
VPAGAPPVEVGGVSVTGTLPAPQSQPDIAGAPATSPDASAATYAALGIGLIGVDGLAPGQQALFTVLVVNTGPVDALPTLVVQDTLPEGLTFSHVATDDWSCASDDGLVVICTSTNPLSGGAAAQLQLAVDVADDATGTLTNVASVSSASLDPISPSPTSVDTLEIMDNTDSPISSD